MREPAPAFVSTERTKRFEKAVAKLQPDQAKALKKQLANLYQNPKHPSLNVHHIDPDRYYWEAYLNKGDRIIYIPEGSHLVLVDIVHHDDISRYGKRPRNQ